MWWGLYKKVHYNHSFINGSQMTLFRSFLIGAFISCLGSPWACSQLSPLICSTFSIGNAVKQVLSLTFHCQLSPFENWCGKFSYALLHSEHHLNLETLSATQLQNPRHHIPKEIWVSCNCLHLYCYLYDSSWCKW